jgi:hypothetical protein
MSLPSEIKEVQEGQFISVENYNQIVRTCNALLKGEGKNGVKFIPAAAGMQWRGSGTGSLDGDTPSGEGSAVAFKGHWNTLTTYAEGDVVFVAGASAQGDLKANTYVSLQSSNINHEPPAAVTSYEDAWWKVVSIGSFPTFVVGDPLVAPASERLITLVPGAGQFHIKDSGGTGEPANDVTSIVGGVVNVGGSVKITGPLEIVFPDDTRIIIDVSEMDQTGSELNGKTFSLRVLPYCDNGLSRRIGMLCTEPFD